MSFILQEVPPPSCNGRAAAELDSPILPHLPHSGLPQKHPTSACCGTGPQEHIPGVVQRLPIALFTVLSSNSTVPPPSGTTHVPVLGVLPLCSFYSVTDILFISLKLWLLHQEQLSLGGGRTQSLGRGAVLLHAVVELLLYCLQTGQ